MPLSASWESQLTALTVVMMASTVCLFAHSTVKAERISLSFCTIGVISLLVEAVAVRTHWPFGRYHYTGRLQPQLLDVPLIVPLAWSAMSLAAREVARRLVAPPVLRWIVGGYLLAAWDLFLDPQMTRDHFWTWSGSSWWQGIPLSNYVGWLVIGTVLVAIVDVIVGPSRPNTGVALVYWWMAFMATVGFLLPIAFDVPIVGLVGGVASLPLATFAFVRKSPWRASL
jgi:uncharacterized membrane protein